MSPEHTRLPYADAETPHEMYADCQAAGANLGADLLVPSPRPEATGRRHAVSTEFRVPAAAARLAGDLHLHLH